MTEEKKDQIDLDAPYDASDPEQVSAKKRSAGRKHKAVADVIKGLMSTKEGRAFVMHFLEMTHIFSSSFTGDPLVTAFKEGERNVGLQLLSLVTREAVDEYILMLKEKK